MGVADCPDSSSRLDEPTSAWRKARLSTTVKCASPRATRTDAAAPRFGIGHRNAAAGHTDRLGPTTPGSTPNSKIAHAARTGKVNWRGVFFLLEVRSGETPQQFQRRTLCQTRVAQRPTGIEASNRLHLHQTRRCGSPCRQMHPRLLGVGCRRAVRRGAGCALCGQDATAPSSCFAT